MTPRRGTKRNPFELGEAVRLRRTGEMAIVAEVYRGEPRIRYRVTLSDYSQDADRFLESRELEAVE